MSAEFEISIDPLIRDFLRKGLPQLKWQIEEESLMVSFTLQVRPGAKKNSIQLLPVGGLKLCIAATPIGGAANEAVIETLSEVFGVSASHVSIIRGEKSRIKTVRIHFEFSIKKNVEYFRKRLEKISW